MAAMTKRGLKSSDEGAARCITCMATQAPTFSRSGWPVQQYAANNGFLTTYCIE